VAWFDPESGRYEASSVEPLEIVVRAAQPEASDTAPSRNAGEGELEGWIKASIAVAIVGLGIAAWIVARRSPR
jgi:hypothetical protein